MPEDRSAAPGPTRLHPPRISGLRDAQASFESYQKTAFHDRPASFFALELAGECGELCNIEKKIWRDPAKEINLSHLAEEASDVLITLLNYCNARGIDLESAVAAKLALIEERRVQGLMGEVKRS